MNKVMLGLSDTVIIDDNTLSFVDRVDVLNNNLSAVESVQNFYDIDSCSKFAPIQFYKYNQAGLAFINTRSLSLKVQRSTIFREDVISGKYDENMYYILNYILKNRDKYYKLFFDYREGVLVYDVTNKLYHDCFAPYSKWLEVKQEAYFDIYALSSNKSLIKCTNNCGIMQLIFVLQSLNLIKDNNMAIDPAIKDLIFAFTEKRFNHVSLQEYHKKTIIPEVSNIPTEYKNVKTLERLSKFIDGFAPSKKKEEKPETIYDSNVIDFIDILSGQVKYMKFDNLDALVMVNIPYDLGFKYRCAYYHPAKDLFKIYIDESTIQDEEIRDLIDVKNVEIIHCTNKSEDKED